MKNTGEYIIYKREVCKIINIKKKYINNNDYYFLQPVYNDSLKIEIPINNVHCILRTLINKKEVERLIDLIPTIEIIENEDFFLEKQYRDLLSSEKHEDLIKIIKTIYSRIDKKEKSNKKICESDKNYLKQAEKYLYEEFSIILKMNYIDTKKYITELINNNK